MKVLYILHLTDERNGSTKAFMNMLLGVVALGIEPMVVVPDNEGVTKKLNEMGVKTLVFNYKYCTYPKLHTIVDYLLFIPKLFLRIVINNVAAKKIAKETQQFDAEIIHTNVSVLDIGFKVAKIMQVPHILHIREYCEQSLGLHFYPSRKCFLKRLKENKSYSICITKSMAKYEKLDGWKNSRVIYDGVITSENETNTIAKENYFLYVGSIREDKGIFDLIHSYSNYCNTSKNIIPLYVVGLTDDIKQQIRLEEMIKMHHIEDDVILFGYCDNVAEMMSKATAVIVPSRAEGFGFVSVEAMQCRTLVIGKDVAGLNEQFDNGVDICGGEIALRYKTDDELTRLMLQVSENGVESYSEMIERAQRVVKILYTHKKNSRLVFDFYNQILMENSKH